MGLGQGGGGEMAAVGTYKFRHFLSLREQTSRDQLLHRCVGRIGHSGSVLFNPALVR